MPTYEYECQSCHRRIEAVQGFADPALTTCEHCGGDLRKVFSAVGIVFKGSGFYKTDSRSSSTTKTPAKATPAPASTSSDAASSTPAATTSTPAAASGD